MELNYICEMLVDQNRYIDDDPIGYKCSSPAKWESKEGYLFCDRCKNLIGFGRLTLPSIYGLNYQQESIRQAVKQI
jgi:hypothetical protein